MEEIPQSSTGTEGGYEREVISLRMVGAFLGGLLLTVIAVCLVAWWLFDHLAAEAARHDVPLSPLAETRQVPPEPRLQVTPQADLKALRTREYTALHSYGWMDRKAGVVRIPIDRAMKLLAKRGLSTPRRKTNTS